MTPALIATILSLLEKYGPSVAKAAVNLFTKPNPSAADFHAIFDAAAALDYDAAELAAKDRLDRKNGTGIYAPPPV